MKYVVYGRSGCSFCDKAVGLLDSLGLPYCYIPLDTHKEHLALFKYARFTTVPQVFGLDGQLVGGYTELEALLKE